MFHTKKNNAQYFLTESQLDYVLLLYLNSKKSRRSLNDDDVVDQTDVKMVGGLILITPVVVLQRIYR